MMYEIRNFKIENKELVTRAETVVVNDTTSKKIVSGYAAVFDSQSRLMTERINGEIKTFYETIDSKALDEADLSEIIYVIDHDPSKLLARTTANNLEVEKNEYGLLFRAQLPNTNLASDLYENINVGNYTENSFRFSVKKQKWERRNNELYRTILEIGKVVDVSTVIQGAYSDTFIVSRSLNDSDIIEEVQEVEFKLSEEVEKDIIEIDSIFLKNESI